MADKPIDDFGAMNSDVMSEFDLDVQEPQTTGRKVATAAKTVGSLLKSTAEGYAKGTASAIRDKFPTSARTVDDVIGVANDLKQLKSDAMHEIQPAWNTLKGITLKMMPMAKNLMPKKLYEKIEKKLQDSYTPEEQQISEEQRKEQSRNTNIEQQLSAIFAAQQETAQLQDQKETAEKQADRLLQHTQFKADQAAFASLDKRLQAMQMFQSGVLTAYMKKSLELKYHHLYVAKDIYTTVRTMTKIVENRLEEIKHNTGLPEYAKVTMKERIVGSMKEKTADKLTSFVDNLASNFTKNLSKNILGSIKNITGSVIPMLSMGADMASMVGPVSKTDAAGGVFGLLGRLIGEGRMKQKLDNKYDTVEDIESDMDTMRKTIGLMLNKTGRNFRGSMSWWKNIIGEAMPGFEVSQTIGNTNLENPNEVVPFDVSTRAAIVEIIPAHLERIGKYVEGLAQYIAPDAIYTDKTFNVVKRKITSADEAVADLYTKKLGSDEDRAARMDRSLATTKAIEANKTTITANDRKLFSQDDFLKLQTKMMATVAAKKIFEFRPEDFKNYVESNGSATAEGEFMRQACKGMSGDEKMLLARYYYALLYNEDGRLDPQAYNSINADIIDMADRYEITSARHAVSNMYNLARYDKHTVGSTGQAKNSEELFNLRHDDETTLKDASKYRADVYKRRKDREDEKQIENATNDSTDAAKLRAELLDKYPEAAGLIIQTPSMMLHMIEKTLKGGRAVVKPIKRTYNKVSDTLGALAEGVDSDTYRILKGGFDTVKTAFKAERVDITSVKKTAANRTEIHYALIGKSGNQRRQGYFSVVHEIVAVDGVIDKLEPAPWDMVLNAFIQIEGSANGDLFKGCKDKYEMLCEEGQANANNSDVSSDKKYWDPKSTSIKKYKATKVASSAPIEQDTPKERPTFDFKEVGGSERDIAITQTIPDLIRDILNVLTRNSINSIPTVESTDKPTTVKPGSVVTESIIPPSPEEEKEPEQKSEESVVSTEASKPSEPAMVNEETEQPIATGVTAERKINLPPGVTRDEKGVYRDAKGRKLSKTKVQHIEAGHIFNPEKNQWYDESGKAARIAKPVSIGKRLSRMTGKAMDKIMDLGISSKDTALKAYRGMKRNMGDFTDDIVKTKGFKRWATVFNNIKDTITDKELFLSKIPEKYRGQVAEALDKAEKGKARLTDFFNDLSKKFKDEPQVQKMLKAVSETAQRISDPVQRKEFVTARISEITTLYDNLKDKDKRAEYMKEAKSKLSKSIKDALGGEDDESAVHGASIGQTEGPKGFFGWIKDKLKKGWNWLKESRVGKWVSGLFGKKDDQSSEEQGENAEEQKPSAFKEGWDAFKKGLSDAKEAIKAPFKKKDDDLKVSSPASEVKAATPPTPEEKVEEVTSPKTEEKKEETSNTATTETASKVDFKIPFFNKPDDTKYSLEFEGDTESTFHKDFRTFASRMVDIAEEILKNGGIGGGKARHRGLLGELVHAVGSIGGGALKGAGSLIGGIYRLGGGIAKGIGSTIGGFAKSGIPKALISAGGNIVKGVGYAAKGIGPAIGGLTKGYGKAFGGLVRGLGSAAGGTVKGLGSFLFPDGLGSSGKKKPSERGFFGRAIESIKNIGKPKYVDVYLKDQVDPGNPLLSVKQQEDGVQFENGNKLERTSDLVEPVFGIKPGETERSCLVTKENIKHGLVDVHNNPVAKSSEKGDGSFLDKLGLPGKILKLGGKIAGGLMDFYGSLFGLSIKGFKATAKVGGTIIGRLFGIEGRDFSVYHKDVIKRLDTIIEIIGGKAPQPVTAEGPTPQTTKSEVPTPTFNKVGTEPSSTEPAKTEEVKNEIPKPEETKTQQEPEDKKESMFSKMWKKMQDIFSNKKEEDSKDKKKEESRDNRTEEQKNQSKTGDTLTAEEQKERNAKAEEQRKKDAEEAEKKRKADMENAEKERQRRMGKDEKKSSGQGSDDGEGGGLFEKIGDFVKNKVLGKGGMLRGAKAKMIGWARSHGHKGLAKFISKPGAVTKGALSKGLTATKGFLGAKAAAIGDAVSNGWEKISGPGVKIDANGQLVDKKTGKVVRDARKDVDEALTENMDRIKDFGKKTWNKTKDVAKQANEKLKPAREFLKKQAIRQKDMAIKQGKWLVDTAKSIPGKTTELVGRARNMFHAAKSSGAASKASSFLHTAGSKIGSVGKAIANSPVGNALSSAGKFVGGKLGTAGRFIGGKASGLAKAAMPHLSKFGGLAKAGLAATKAGWAAGGLKGAALAGGKGLLALATNPVGLAILGTAAAAFSAYKGIKGASKENTKKNLGIKEGVQTRDRWASGLSQALTFGLGGKGAAKAMRKVIDYVPGVGLTTALMGDKEAMTDKEIQKFRAKCENRIKKGMKGYDTILAKFNKAVRMEDWPLARSISSNETSLVKNIVRAIPLGAVIWDSAVGLKNLLFGNDDKPMTEKEIKAFRSKMQKRIAKKDKMAEKLLEKFNDAVAEQEWKKARELSGKKAEGLLNGKSSGRNIGMIAGLALGGPLGMLAGTLVGDLFDDPDKKPLSKKEIKETQEFLQKQSAYNPKAKEMLQQFNDAVEGGDWKTARKLSSKEGRYLITKIGKGLLKTARVGIGIATLGLSELFIPSDQNKPMSEQEIKKTREALQFKIKKGNKMASKKLEAFDEAIAQQKWEKARKIAKIPVEQTYQKVGKVLGSIGRGILGVGTLGLSELIMPNDDEKPLKDEEINKFRESMQRKIKMGDKGAERKLEAFDDAVGEQKWKRARAIAKLPNEGAVKKFWKGVGQGIANLFGSDDEAMSEMDIKKTRSDLEDQIKAGNKSAQKKLDMFNDAVEDQNWKKARKIAAIPNKDIVSKIRKATADFLWSGDQDEAMTDAEVKKFEDEMQAKIKGGDKAAQKVLDQFHEAVSQGLWSKARKISGVQKDGILKAAGKGILKGIGKALTFGFWKGEASAEEVEKLREQIEEKVDEDDFGGPWQKVMDRFVSLTNQGMYNEARDFAEEMLSAGAGKLARVAAEQKGASEMEHEFQVQARAKEVMENIQKSADKLSWFTSPFKKRNLNVLLNKVKSPDGPITDEYLDNIEQELSEIDEDAEMSADSSSFKVDEDIQKMIKAQSVLKQKAVTAREKISFWKHPFDWRNVRKLVDELTSTSPDQLDGQLLIDWNNRLAEMSDSGVKKIDKADVEKRAAEIKAKREAKEAGKSSEAQATDGADNQTGKVEDPNAGLSAPARRYKDYVKGTIETAPGTKTDTVTVGWKDAPAPAMATALSNKFGSEVTPETATPEQKAEAWSDAKKAGVVTASGEISEGKAKAKGWLSGLFASAKDKVSNLWSKAKDKVAGIKDVTKKAAPWVAGGLLGGVGGIAAVGAYKGLKKLFSKKSSDAPAEAVAPTPGAEAAAAAPASMKTVKKVNGTLIGYTLVPNEGEDMKSYDERLKYLQDRENMMAKAFRRKPKVLKSIYTDEGMESYKAAKSMGASMRGEEYDASTDPVLQMVETNRNLAPAEPANGAAAETPKKTSLWNKLKGGAKVLWSKAKDKVGKARETVKDLASGLWDKAKTVGGKLWKGYKNLQKSQWGWMENKFSSWASKDRGKVLNTINDIGATVTGKMRHLWEDPKISEDRKKYLEQIMSMDTTEARKLVGDEEYEKLTQEYAHLKYKDKRSLWDKLTGKRVVLAENLGAEQSIKSDGVTENQSSEARHGLSFGTLNRRTKLKDILFKKQEELDRMGVGRVKSLNDKIFTHVKDQLHVDSKGNETINQGFESTDETDALSKANGVLTGGEYNLNARGVRGLDMFNAIDKNFELMSGKQMRGTPMTRSQQLDDKMQRSQERHKQMSDVISREKDETTKLLADGSSSEETATREQTDILSSKLDKVIEGLYGVRDATIEAGEGTSKRITSARNEAIAQSATYANDAISRTKPKPKEPGLKPPAIDVTRPILA